MTVSNGFPFRWIDNYETRDLFKFISPLLVLPDRRTLAGRILNATTNDVQSNIQSLASNNKIVVTITFDGWKNVVEQKIMGVVLITSNGSVLVWDAENISGERQRAEEVIKRIELLIEKAISQNIQINALVTDSAGGYASARYFINFY